MGSGLTGEEMVDITIAEKIVKCSLLIIHDIKQFFGQFAMPTLTISSTEWIRNGLQMKISLHWIILTAIFCHIIISIHA